MVRQTGIFGRSGKFLAGFEHVLTRSGACWKGMHETRPQTEMHPCRLRSDNQRPGEQARRATQQLKDADSR